MKKYLIVLLLILSIILPSCADFRIHPHTLKIAVIASIDALPLYIAENERYFYKEGVTVEIVPVATPTERDSLLRSGQVDAVVTDLVSTLLINQDQIEVLVVRTLLETTEKSPRFKLVSTPGSEKLTVGDLKNDEIGVVRFTDAEYLLERVINKAGLRQGEYIKIDIQPTADLYNLLMNGKVQAAFLPEPYASLAEKKDANSIVDDIYWDLPGAAVIAFDIDYALNKKDAVKGFLSGYERAVKEYNGDKNKFADLVAELDLVPSSIRGSYDLPNFPTASVPEETHLSEALVWLLDAEILELTFNYDYRQYVSSDYLPEDD